MCPSICCLLLAFMFAPPLGAQGTSCLHRTLPVNVIDSRRRLIRLSDPSEFEGKLHGKGIKILSIRPDERPHRIVILLDTSGSMLGDPPGRKWQMALLAATHLARANLPNTSLALLIFSKSVKEQIGFSQGASAIAARLSEIGDDPGYAKKKVRGTTALLDTIHSSLALLADPGFADVVYVITDAGDNGSRTRLRTVRDTLASAGVRLFVSLVIEDFPPPVTTEEQTGPSEFADLTGATGGFVLGPLGMGPLGKVNYDLTKNELGRIEIGLDALYLAMTHDDLLEVELPGTVKKWSNLRLELSPNTRSEHKDWLVVYPRDLSPCSGMAH